MLKPEVEDYSSLAGSLIGKSIALKHFGEEETNLESAFMALTIGTGTRSSIFRARQSFAELARPSVVESVPIASSYPLCIPGSKGHQLDRLRPWEE